MLSEKIQEALNDQLNFELYSSYLYLSMAAYFEASDLQGHAHWMKIQTQEELFHVDKLYGFINERDGRVLLKPVKGPPTEWASPLDAFQKAYEHEGIVTGRINKLSDLSLSESDHATHNFLRWFINEQVEEEASVKNVVGQLKLVGQDGQGIFLLDKELGARVLTPPQAASGQ